MSIKDLEIKKLNVLSDDRGEFFEFIRKENINNKFGQIYITTAFPEKVKGNHYHKRKTEWFCVIHGEGKLFLKDCLTKEQKIINMDQKNMVVVKIPSNVIHAIKNIGKEKMILLAHISESYNEKDPDTYKEIIME